MMNEEVNMNCNFCGKQVNRTGAEVSNGEGIFHLACYHEVRRIKEAAYRQASLLDR